MLRWSKRKWDDDVDFFETRPDRVLRLALPQRTAIRRIWSALIFGCQDGALIDQWFWWELGAKY
jgi:hypothetical protein